MISKARCRLREKLEKVSWFVFILTALWGRTQYLMQVLWGGTGVGYEEEKGTVGKHLCCGFNGKETTQGTQA